MSDIDARRAGREALSTVADLWRGVPAAALEAICESAGQEDEPPVGEQFAALRERRRRRREGAR